MTFFQFPSLNTLWCGYKNRFREGIASVLAPIGKAASICCALVLFGGCENFLNESPDERVTLDSLKKISRLLVYAYSDTPITFTEWFTDNVEVLTGVNARNYHKQSFKFEPLSSSVDDFDGPAPYWSSAYAAISHANEALFALESITAKDEKEQARKNALRSEALLTRAFSHFNLVNIFGLHYSESQDSPGIPHILTPETTLYATYKRETVRRNYELIEKDMLEGIELAGNTRWEGSGKYHFNRNAALAFASRFYLYTKDFEKCLMYSDMMLGSTPESYVRDFSSDEYRNTSNSLPKFVSLYQSTGEQANIMIVTKYTLHFRPNDGYGPTSDLYHGLFGDSPFSRSGHRDGRSIGYHKGADGTFPARFPALFQRTNITSNTGFAYTAMSVFRGEEVLLNRVEANIYLGNLDAAHEDLQILVDRRYTGSTSANLTPDVLEDYYDLSHSDPGVLKDHLLHLYYTERRKEFLAEGLRWFDIKRFGLTVTHVLKSGDEVVLSADDKRKAIELPKFAVDLAGLEQNPGWEE